MDYIGSDNPLRDPQEDVFRDIAGHLDKGHTYGYGKRPTGTGKTVIYVAEIDATQARTIVLTPRTNLIEQAYETFLNTDLFDFDPDSIGRYHAGISSNDRKKSLKTPVLLTTYNSFTNLIKRGEISIDDYEMLILDEVHHARGNVVRPIIEELFEKIYVQGWTATDTFISGETIGQYLFRGQVPFHSTSIPEAVERGEITPYKNIIVETHMSPGERIRVIGMRDYTGGELRRIINQRGRDEAAINLFLEGGDPETGLKFRDMNSIWYCAGIDHAEEVADMLTDVFGENYALAVSGMTRKDDLQEILEMHKKGEIPIIVNADLLIEGFDSPKTQLAMMLRPTRSLIIAEQTGGRILRTDPENPDKIGYIITLIDEGMYDIVPFGVVAGGMVTVPRNVKINNTVKNPINNRPKSKFDVYDYPEIEGLEVLTSELDLKDFVRRRNKINFTFDRKPSDYMTRSQWADRLNEDGTVFKKVWDYIKETWFNSIDDGYDIEINGITLSRRLVGTYRHRGKDDIFIHSDAESELMEFVDAFFEGDEFLEDDGVEEMNRWIS